MKKVTAIIGSQRKGITYQAVQEFEKNLITIIKRKDGLKQIITIKRL